MNLFRIKRKEHESRRLLGITPDSVSITSPLPFGREGDFSITRSDLTRPNSRMNILCRLKTTDNKAHAQFITKQILSI